VATVGSGVDIETVVEGTMRINKKCREAGGARGRLLGLLQQELEDQLPLDAHHILNSRDAPVGLAYQEISFFKAENIVQTEFESREDVIQAILNSSMFLFFSTNFPFRLNFKEGQPVLARDGYFTVPRERFGCPLLPADSNNVDREVTISVFPHSVIGLTASLEADSISPAVASGIGDDTVDEQIKELFRRATQVSSDEVVWDMYESGQNDASKWIQKEELYQNIN